MADPWGIGKYGPLPNANNELMEKGWFSVEKIANPSHEIDFLNIFHTIFLTVE